MARKNRWLALVGLIISVLVLGFDLTIMNVALPTLAADIGASTGELQWIVDSYAVVVAAAMLPAGLLGDRFGRRKLLVTGLVIFMGGSILGAVASTPGAVIAARTIMGLGAALIMPLALSVIPTLFKGKEQTKAIAAVTVATSAGLPFGPLVSGWLLDHFYWGSVFLVNIPLVAIGIVVCLTLIPETRDPSSPTIDMVSTVLGILGLGALVYGIIEAPEEGWGDPIIVTSMVAGVLMLIGLVVRARRETRPMLDLELLRNPTFRWNTIIAALAMFVLMGLVFVLPLYLQAVLGYDAFGTGLRLLPLLFGMIIVARAVPPLTARFGSRPMMVAGMALLGIAMLLGSTTDTDTGYGFTALWMITTGLGLGSALMPAMDNALAALPEGREGTGTGLLTTLRQVGWTCRGWQSPPNPPTSMAWGWCCWSAASPHSPRPCSAPSCCRTTGRGGRRAIRPWPSPDPVRSVVPNNEPYALSHAQQADSSHSRSCPVRGRGVHRHRPAPAGERADPVAD